MAAPDVKSTGTAQGFEAVIDSVADLLQTAVDWLRQEAGGLIQEKIVAPIQRLGLTLASAAAAAALLVLGLTFIAVALFLFLGEWLGYPGALLSVGAVLMLGSVGFLVIKVRSMQK